MNIPIGGGGGSGADSSECTALAAEVLEGKTAVTSDSNDNAIAGTMPNNGAVSADLDCGNSFVIPAGFHDGSGIVTANSLASQTSGTASAADILSGQTAWVSGSQVTGSMTNQGAVTSSLNCGGSYTIPAGYHNGSGVVSANSLSSQTSATAAAAQILSGYTAWVNGSQISGSMSDRSGSTTSATSSLDSSNSRVRMAIPNNGYYNTSAYLYNSYSSMASTISLTADKMQTRSSCLGITGTQKWADEYGSPNPLLYSGSLSFSTTEKTVTIGTDNNTGWILLCVYFSDESSSWIDGTYAFVPLGKPSYACATLLRNSYTTPVCFMNFYRDSSGVITANYYTASSSVTKTVSVRQIINTNADANGDGDWGDGW